MNKRYIAGAFLAIVLAALPAREMRGQETTPPLRVGLSASIQESQFDILVPIWINNHLAIAPAVGLVWAEDGGSDIRFALAPRYYLHREKFAPYIGGKFGALLASPDSGAGTTDILVGLAVGGEYFLDEHFSLGVESQLNLIMSDERSLRFGNPGRKNINTGAAVFATVYF